MSPEFVLESTPPEKPARALTACRPTPPPLPEFDELVEFLGSLDPPDIIAYAFDHITHAEAITAAFVALADVWPGHYLNALEFEERLRSATRAARVPGSRLVLVPTTRDKMAEGSAYLAATIGATGILAEVLYGPSAKARKHKLLFRLDPIP